MPSNSPKFTCESCGKEFRWKPEIAGRKAKCKCGQTLTVPATPPAPAVTAPAAPAPTRPAPARRAPVRPSPARSSPLPPAPPAVEVPPEPNPLEWPDEPAAGYDTAQPPPPPADETCPSCGADLPANAVLCVNCGYNLKTGKKLAGVTPAATPSAAAAVAAPEAPGAAAAGGAGAAYAGTYKRAKIDQVTTVEEETASWQGYLTILAGVGALGLGVWQLLSPHDPGDPDTGRRRGRWFRQMIRWLYDLGGNGAVVAAFALIGFGLIAWGVLQVRKKVSTEE